MKVKNILYIPVVLILTCGFVSCKKYLEKKPASYLAVPETIADLQAILDRGDYMNLHRTPIFNEASADDYFLLQASFDAMITPSQNIYKWIPYDYVWANDWSQAYFPVYNANICLERIEDIPVNGVNRDAWNNVKGSALLYRAYYFLCLVWQYAKAYDDISATSEPGIVLRLGSDYNIPSVRSSVKQSYEQILKDAKDAALYLPDGPLHVMRPSKAAAYGVLARTYLSMRRYDSALKYSNLCLGIKKDLIDYKNIIVTAEIPFQQFNTETIFYTEMSGYNEGAPVFTSRALIDTFLYSSYSDNDLRKTAFFKTSGNYKAFKGTYAQIEAGFLYFFSGIATDEMYLTSAECYARTGNKDSALANLNTLLEKRWSSNFIPITAATNQEALSIILTERRKELVMRGLRWIDIKRLNKEGANIAPTRSINGQRLRLEPNANYYALPLPADIINITGMPQNPYP